MSVNASSSFLRAFERLPLLTRGSQHSAGGGGVLVLGCPLLWTPALKDQEQRSKRA